MYKAIIIEDELPSQDLLTHLLADYCPEIVVAGIAVDANSGIKLANEVNPDLVFLDIEMPGGDGFEVLKAFDPIPFKVIFVTGYDQYAIQAIRFSALDYLLKPVNIDELQSAVQKAINEQQTNLHKVHNVEWNLAHQPQSSGRLVLSSDREHKWIELDEVLYLQAEGGYVYFILEGAIRQMASHSLGYYESLLPAGQFFRIHHSFIVNCQKVASVNTGRGGEVLLKNGSSIPIAYRRKSAFIQLMGLKK